MSEVSSQYVKRGYWINQSQGPVMGKTITTDTKTGTIIIALLAICVSLTSSHLWHILTFVYHQSRANGKPSSGLFRQQQVLLRTLPTPSSLLADSIKLLYKWKGTKSSTIFQSIPQITVPLLFTIGSLAAGIFSSLVVTGSNLEVLVNSPYCGFFLSDDGMLSESYTAQVHSTSRQYVQDCYKDNVTLPARCNNIFTRTHIPSSMDSAPCPFSSEMCSSPTLAFDSGLLDINDAFGFNLADSDRIKYRKRTSCAILSLEGRTRTVSLNASEFPQHIMGRPPLPQEELLLYYFGKRSDVPAWENVTYIVSLAEANVSRHLDIDGQTHYAGDSSPSYDPLPEMKRDDADIALLRVKKMASLYFNPVDDLMFSAHRSKIGVDISSGQNITWYLSDVPQTLVGCTQQYQFCAKNTSTGDFCTELSSLNKTLSVTNRARGNKIQNQVLTLLYRTARVFSAVEVRSLNASSTFGSLGVMSSLPDDQWKMEFRHLVSNIWADHQTVLTDYAVGPKLRDLDTSWPYNYPPATKEGKQLCNMIKMRKPGGFVNINVFGLAFVVTFSVTITLIDLMLLRFLIYLSKFRKALSPRIDRWIQDNVFQLQRRAYEAEGEGTWKDLDKEVPIAMDRTMFPDLAIQTLPASLSCSACPHGSRSKLNESIFSDDASTAIHMVQTRTATSSTYPTIKEGQDISPVSPIAYHEGFAIDEKGPK